MRTVSVRVCPRQWSVFDDVRLVTESFRDFCKSEILTGDNSYDAGGVHGLQVRDELLIEVGLKDMFRSVDLGGGEGREISKVSTRVVLAPAPIRI